MNNTVVLRTGRKFWELMFTRFRDIEFSPSIEVQLGNLHDKVWTYSYHLPTTRLTRSANFGTVSSHTIEILPTKFGTKIGTKNFFDPHPLPPDMPGK